MMGIKASRFTSNTPNFSSPSDAFERVAFGTTTSTAPNQSPRQIQLALKLLFEIFQTGSAAALTQFAGVS